MTPRTILMVAPYFPPQGGGLERYVYEISARLAKHGAKVVVVASGEKGSDAIEELDGIKVYRLARSFTISNTPFSFSWFSKLRRIMREEDPDVINIHTPVPGLGNIAASVAGQRAVVVTYHGVSMHKPQGSFMANAAVWLYERTLLRVLLRRADKIICVSEQVRAFLSEYDHNISIITPGVDTEVFFPGAAQKDDTPTVLFVGGLNASEQYKGLSTLLEALHEAQKSLELQLLVVGDGDLRSAYERKASEYGLTAMFLGRVPHAELAALYNRAHLFALPTQNESFGMAVLEALSCGIPVVASRVGGIPELVEHGANGFLVDPKDVAALARRIADVLAETGVRARMGAAARAKAHAYSWSERADAVQALCAQAMMRSRLLVQLTAYYPPHIGGIERVAQEIATSWSAQGGRSAVLTSNDRFKTAIAYESGVQVRRLASVEFAHTPWAPTLLLHLLALPRRSLAHVHLAQAYWADFAWLILPLRRIPYIAHYHLDVEPSGFFGALFVAYKKLMWGPILRGAQRVVVCSPEQVALVERYGVARGHIELVPNGVAAEFFSAPRAQSGPLQLAYIGRLAAQKRVERLVEMMAELRMPAQLTIAGDGDERGKLQRAIAEKSASNVSLAGSLDAHEVRTLLARTDVFVIASEKEGMPLSLLEAMAAGVPVVGADVIGIRELIEECGVLIGEPFAERAARALEALARDEPRRFDLAQRSIKKARAFSWGASMQKLVKLYQTI